MVERELTAADLGDDLLLDLIGSDDPIGVLSVTSTPRPVPPTAARRLTSGTGSPNSSAEWKPRTRPGSPLPFVARSD